MLLRLYCFPIFFLFLSSFLISCSPDDDNQDPIEGPITVTTSDFSTTMDEHPQNGQVIGTVSGSTNEGNDTFSITNQTPSGAFSIDATSGELKVEDARLFNFETNPLITGNVRVANGDVFENAAVAITMKAMENIYDGNFIVRTQEEVNVFGAISIQKLLDHS